MQPRARVPLRVSPAVRLRLRTLSPPAGALRTSIDRAARALGAPRDARRGAHRTRLRRAVRGERRVRARRREADDRSRRRALRRGRDDALRGRGRARRVDTTERAGAARRRANRSAAVAPRRRRPRPGATLPSVVPARVLQGTVLSYLGTMMWYEAITPLDLARTTAIVVPSVPLLSLVATFVLLREVPTLLQAVGMAVAAVGVLGFVTAPHAVSTRERAPVWTAPLATPEAPGDE